MCGECQHQNQDTLANQNQFFEHSNYAPSSLEPYYSNSPRLFTTEQHDGEASTYIKTSHAPKQAVNPERQTGKKAKGEKCRRIVTQLRILLSLLVSITTVSCLFFLYPQHKKQESPLEAFEMEVMVFEEELANLSIDLSQLELNIAVIQQEMSVSLTQIERYVAGITQLVDKGGSRKLYLNKVKILLTHFSAQLGLECLQGVFLLGAS